MKCRLCKKDLLVAEGLGYIHPTGTDCPEWDGMLADSDVRYEWDKRYPYSGKSMQEYADLCKKLQNEVNKCKEKIKDLEKQLGESRTKEKEHLLVPRLRTLLNRTTR